MLPLFELGAYRFSDLGAERHSKRSDFRKLQFSVHYHIIFKDGFDVVCQFLTCGHTDIMHVFPVLVDMFPFRSM